MRKLALTLLLFATPTFAEKPSTNPADYLLTVHVVYSSQATAGPQVTRQLLDVVIDGKQMQLQSEIGTDSSVLALGDYRAQLYTPRYFPKTQNGYDIYAAYRFLFPDGKVREYDVVSIGSKAGQTPNP